MQDGLLSLDDTIDQFVDLTPIPGQTADPRLATITVRNLLEHLSGIGAYGSLGYDPDVPRRRGRLRPGHRSTR